MNTHISPREWMIAIWIAIAATALMQIPYALGYAFAPHDVEYTGLLINSEDYSYYAIMLQGYAGAWQYHIQYTTELHDSAFLYGFYLFLGYISRSLNISIVAMWHASRIIASLTLMVATFGFISTFLEESRERRTAYLIALFGSGFDWAPFSWERFDAASGIPLDFRVPEAHLFFTALTYPHIAMGIALVLASFWLWLQSLERELRHDALALAIAILLVGIIYPFLIFLVAGVLGASWVYLSFRAKRILWRDAFALALVLAPSAPLCVYYAFVLQTNAVFRTWNEQATTLSPNPLHYLLAYGAMIVLALPTLRTEARGKFAFLWLWLGVAAVLLYAPLGAQRRFVQGVQVPLAILATAGLYRVLFPRFEKTRWFQQLLSRPNYSVPGLQRFAVVLLLLALSAANVVVLFKLSMFTAIEQPAAFFVPGAQIAAIDWLGQNTRWEDAVLASYWTGSLIPARSGNAVFVGQRYETNRFDEKRVLAERFFGVKADDTFRKELLAQYHIAYVFWGEQERGLGNYDPARSNFLEQVYERERVRIYRVRAGAN